MTIYRSAADLPAFDDYSMRGRTYRYLGRPPLYPFGHGLSYTTFRVLRPHVDGREVSVSVANTGGRAGDEIVQLYLSRPDLPAFAPRRWLAAFRRVRLAQGQHQKVSFELPPEAFSNRRRAGETRLVPGSVGRGPGGRSAARRRHLRRRRARRRHAPHAASYRAARRRTRPLSRAADGSAPTRPTKGLVSRCRRIAAGGFAGGGVAGAGGGAGWVGGAGGWGGAQGS